MYLVRNNIKGRKLYEVQLPSYAETHHDGMLWMEMMGAEQACRAIWAFIVKHRKERTTQSLRTCVIADGLKTHYIHINPTTKYHMIPTETGLVMFHEGFNKMNGRFMLGGDKDTPSPWFKNSLQRLVSVPFLPEWIDDLWKRGIEGSLIEAPNFCAGAQVWILRTYAARWEDLMTKMIKEGTISG